MKNLLKFSSDNNKRILFLCIIGTVLLFAAVFIGILSGSTEISIRNILQAVLNADYANSDISIFLYIRLPRSLASLICGAALSVAGVIIQTVLQNNLASPSIIGVNAGAGLAVTLCTAIGLWGSWITSVFAFFGAFVTVSAVSLISKKHRASRGTVILIGVAFNSLLGAFSDSIRTFFPDVSILSNDFRIGDFSAVTYKNLIPSSLFIIIATIILITLSNELEILGLGDEQAKSLGINISAYRTAFLLLAAVLSGCAVSVAGLLSFVGLIVPNIMKRLAGSSVTSLVPLCALFGGSFVCLSDTLARTIFSPYEIPVGIIMAFLGAPFFVFILIRGKGGHKNA